MKIRVRAKTQVTRWREAAINNAFTIGALCTLRLILIPVDASTVGWVCRVLNRHADKSRRNLLCYDLISPLPVRDVTVRATDNTTTPVACLEPYHT